MASASSMEVAKNFGQFRMLAQREPVAITSYGHENCYLISAEEYHRLKSRDRDVWDVSDMPTDLIEAIAAAEMDPRHAHLDKLLDGEA
jgi:PHD/YefM family antitoxin component YafN of YafNO toxin-antitoxin module